MKATELKIGNLIYVNGSDLATVVCPAIFKNIKTRDAIEGWDIAHLQPIPLTEEWLLKFGFETENCGWWKLNHNGIFVELYNGDDGLEWDIDGLTLGKNLRFVHELQNRFHSLYFEELTIKDASAA